MIPSWKIPFGILTLALVWMAMGCQQRTVPSQANASAQADHDSGDGSHGHDSAETDQATEAKVSSVLTKLNAEDRQLAEAQKFCAVMNHERLGGMGSPLKLDIKGQPVFVCCKGCRQKALKKPDETLAKAADLKSKNAATQY